MPSHSINQSGAALRPCGEAVRHIRDRLRRAEAALDADPDLAALVLDGALSELVAVLAGRDADRPDALRAIERRAPLVALRLRLALRAPSPRARLDHCRALCELLAPVAASARPAKRFHLSWQSVGGRGYLHVSRRRLRAQSARPLRQAR